MKKCGAWIAALAVVLCMGVTVSATPEPPTSEQQEAVGTPIPLSEEFTIVAETDRLEMGIDLITCNVAVRDKTYATVWYTNPPDLEQQEISAEMADQLRSQLIISFVDDARNEMTINSYEGCVEADAFEVRQIENGVRITYDFTEEVTRFRIPVEIALAEDYMQVSIVYADIEEYGTSRLTSVSLLPYFGTGHSAEDGYAFVPDGSGALIRFSDNTRAAAAYNQPVYGSDPSVNLLLKSTDSAQSIRMPVFGIQKADNAFLAVIHEGEAAASLRAESDSGLSPYTAVNSAFIYHQQDMTGIRDKESNQRTVLMLHDQPVKEAPCVRYYFLGGEDANYSGMARRYQQYLEKETGLTLRAEGGRPVCLQFFGKTSKEATFLGIPYRKSVVATTLDQTAQALEQLRNKGLSDANVLLYGFEKGGFENRYPFEASLDRAVGGKKGYTQLLEAAGNSRIYMVYDLTRDYGGGLRLFSRNSYAKSLNKVNVLRQNPLMSTWDWNEKGPSWKYVAASSLEKNGDRLLSSLTEQGISGVLFHHMGSELYSDFHESRPTDRQQLSEQYRALTEKAKKAGIRMAADGGNAYLAGLADLQIEAPVDNSGQDIFSEAVPFYAMVYHGYVTMSSQPVNLAVDPQAFLMTLLESGVQPSYWLTGCASSELSETSLQFLYNSSFDKWEEEIVSAGTRYTQLQQGLEQVRIREHRRSGDLSIVQYENGVVLAANYGEEEQQWQGHTVPAGEVVRIEVPVGP